MSERPFMHTNMQKLEKTIQFNLRKLCQFKSGQMSESFQKLMVSILYSYHYTQWNKNPFTVFYNYATLGFMFQNLFAFFSV